MIDPLVAIFGKTGISGGGLVHGGAHVEREGEAVGIERGAQAGDAHGPVGGADGNPPRKKYLYWPQIATAT